MTLQTMGGGIIPHPASYGALVEGTSSYSSLLIDASTEKVAVIFRAPKTGNLQRVGFRTVAVGTADTLKVSFQDVSASTGDPDGVVDQFRTVASGSVLANTWIRTGIISADGTDGGALRAVTKGDLLCVVIEFNAFVAGSVNIGALSTGLNNASYLGQCYVDFFTGAWSKQVSSLPVLAIEYDDGSFPYYPLILPASGLNFQVYNNTSSPDEVALVFSTPYPMTVWGAWVAGNLAGDTDLVLYDSDGNTVLRTVSIDKDQRVNNGSASVLMAPFSSNVNLLANTTYRLSLRPSTASNINVGYFDVNAAANLDQTEGQSTFSWSERTDAGAWTAVTTRRPMLGLALTAFDDGVGGGVSRSRIVNAGGV